MRCERCGAENFDGEKTCMGCGQPLGSASSTDGSRSGGAGRGGWVLAGVIAAGVLVLGAMFLSSSSPSGGGGGGGGQAPPAPQAVSQVSTGSATNPYSWLTTRAVTPEEQRYALGVATPLVKKRHPDYKDATPTVSAFTSKGDEYLDVTYGRIVEFKADDGTVTRMPRILTVSIKDKGAEVNVFESD